MIKLTLTVKDVDLAPVADRIVPYLTGSRSSVVNAAAKKMLLSLPPEKQEELIVSTVASKIDAAAEIQKLIDKSGIKAEVVDARADRL